MILLRSALFNAWFFLMTLALVTWGIVLRRAAPHRVHALARLWARLSIAGARVLCGIRVDVTGLEHLPAGAALVASQHQSAFDTMIWLCILTRASYVVKAELGRVPLFGPLLRPGGQILVDRAAGATALRHMVRDAQHAVQAGHTVVIFPEGTRVAPGQRTALLPGIAALTGYLGMPVLPAATNSGVLWGRRAFLKRPGTIHVAIGPAIAPNLPRRLMTQRIEQAWHDLAGSWPETVAHPVDNSVR